MPVRIAELSRDTGVPVQTIKYYLREGLLPPGERTSPNQAQYDQRHVRRLRLVRALVDVGGLSIAATRAVLARMDAPGTSVLDALGKAQYAITTPRDHLEDEAWRAATQQVTDLIDRRSWKVRPTNPARQALAEVLATLHRLGQDSDLTVLDDYAEASERIAAAEVGIVLRQPDVDSMAEAVVIWTTLGDTLLAALRRLAQENEAAARLGVGQHATELRPGR
jgi:DNA-binding transcriptional MerR regulator